jgi:hypothetical protein
MAKPLIGSATLKHLKNTSERAMQDSGTHAGSRNGVPFKVRLKGLLTILGTTGGSTRIDEEIRKAEGSHRLYVPLGSDVATGDTWTCQGRVYDVVWAPLPAALDVDRLIGLKEIR